MDELSITSKCLKAARDNFEREYNAQITKINKTESKITKRLDELNQKKHNVARANGNLEARDNDLIEINAGGKIVAAKRSTLTQQKGTRMEALFSGRWEQKLQRDSNGRIFLDVNPKCFQAIVDYLNELAISSEVNPPRPPSVEDEYKHILRHDLELFALLDHVTASITLDSTIVKDETQATLLHDWLKADGSDGKLNLLYKSSRDGRYDLTFHSKCDDKGSTLTIIETTDGHIFGGYSNTPWSSSNEWKQANKAFLFNLSSTPQKMKLKNPMRLVSSLIPVRTVQYLVWAIILMTCK